MRWFLVLMAVVLVVASLSACGSSSSGGDAPLIFPVVENAAPVASAGADSSVPTNTLATLDGSASSDANGDALTYSWTIVNVPAGSALSASLPNATSASPTFTPDVDGQYVFSLVVNDGKADSAADTVTVTSSNFAPVANAGANQNVLHGVSVSLNALGTSDPNGDAIVSYNWTMDSKPAGSSAVLFGATTAAVDFNTDLDGDYVVCLVVSDGALDSAPDCATVTATNAAPVADAGTPLTVARPVTVTLDGSVSYDDNGDFISFAWTFSSVPAGSSLDNASISGADTDAPSFNPDVDGNYVLRLVVNDGFVDSAPDTVLVTTNNTAPVADAGANQNSLHGALIYLNGSASSDANGDPLTYAWTISSKPSGSASTLSGAATSTPSFTPDKDGSYVISLTVNDGGNNSLPDTVTITATNATPIADAGNPQTVAVGAWAILNGSASSDANGDPITYAWTFSSKPSGSASALVNSTTASPGFSPDAAGSYVASLVVNDGITSSVADTVTITATSNWLGVQNLSGTTYAGYAPQIEMDGNGNAIAVWAQSNGVAQSIYANIYNATSGTWGGKGLIENSPGSNSPQIAMNAIGNAIAVWSMWDGSLYSTAANIYNAASGTWGSTVFIESSAGNISTPQIAMDTNGNGIAVWTQTDGTYESIYANIYNAASGTWGGAGLIESFTFKSIYPKIAMDANGNGIAVWGQSNGNTENIYANIYNAASGTWGGAVLIETTEGRASYPQIATDASGNAIAVWQQQVGTGESIYANIYNAASGTWGDAGLIETSEASAYNPQIAMNASGNAIAVWQQPDSIYQSIYVNTYSAASGTWGGAVLIENYNYMAGAPQIAMDVNGNASAVWAQHDGVNQSIYANTYSAASGTWAGSQLIEVTGVDASVPQIAMDASGNAMAVWRQTNIYSNRYEP